MMLVLAIAFAAASCGSAEIKLSSEETENSEKLENTELSCGTSERTLSAEESAILEKIENAELFYVMVGTDFDKKAIRLRQFKGVSDDKTAAWLTSTEYDNGKEIVSKYKGWSNFVATWWEHDPNDYSYGDIFIANGIEPEIREVPYYDGTVEDRFFGSEVKLEKLGNCKDLLTLKKLTIEAADYDGYGVWSVKMHDPKSKNDYGYYYGFRNDACFGIELEGADEGEIYVFAFIGDIPIIPVEEGKA